MDNNKLTIMYEVSVGRKEPEVFFNGMKEGRVYVPPLADTTNAAIVAFNDLSKFMTLGLDLRSLFVAWNKIGILMPIPFSELREWRCAKYNGEIDDGAPYLYSTWYNPETLETAAFLPPKLKEIYDGIENKDMANLFWGLSCGTGKDGDAVPYVGGGLLEDMGALYGYVNFSKGPTGNLQISTSGADDVDTEIQYDVSWRALSGIYFTFPNHSRG